MDKNIDVRYGNLKKSVNNAMKLLCNKIEEMKKELKELKAEKVQNEKDTCKSCNCEMGSVDKLKERVSKIEERLEVNKDETENEPLDAEIN